MHRKITLLWVATILVAVWGLCAGEAFAGRAYWRSALTGSGAGALDAVSKTAATPGMPLATGDMAIVVVPGQKAYTYTFDAANTSAESSPAIIAPDDAGATGRWLRVPPELLASEVAGLATVATSGSYNDLSDKPTTITSEQASLITSSAAASHAHANLAAIAAVTDAGSGQIITSTERTNLGTAYSHSQDAHAPSTAEQNVNADWSAASGDAQILNKPTIPSATSQLSNDSGYLSSYTETDPSVNALGSATLSCTSGQVAKYNGSAWDCADDTDTNTDVQWSGTSIGLTAATGRTSLELGTAATADTGTGSTNVILGNDARLSDARTPTAHDQAWSTITSTPGPVLSAASDTLATRSDVASAISAIEFPSLGITPDQEAAITGSASPSAANVFATIADVTAGGGYTDEAAQDATGAMVTGNTETGIAVTYDDTANKLNFDASHTHPDTVSSVNTQTGAVVLDTDDIAEGTTHKYYTPAAPGDIGGTTPAAGTFTTLTATSFNLGEPPTGTTGEISMPEDPANGSNVVGFKAPSSVAADQLWVLPATDGTTGQVMSTNGSRVLSWATAGGSVDLTDPGPIGSATPDTGAFTTLTATSFDWGTPATGQTGEIALLEDPANGANSVTIKAPATLAANVIWTLPAADGTTGQVMKTDAAGTLSWYTPILATNNLSEYTATAGTVRTNLGLGIGTNVQAYDADLADLADGSLTGGLVGTGISATNVSTGTLPDTVIPAAIARDTEMTLAPVATPTTATDTCTAGTWAYDSVLGYIYICIATNTWGRAALATW